jgi:hypothetical protein
MADQLVKIPLILAPGSHVAKELIASLVVREDKIFHVIIIPSHGC